jgi:hypothetical protein
MIWFFHRGPDRLQYEIRLTEGASGYELVVMGPDGVPRVERFDDTISLLERSLELQRTLVTEGWAADRSAQREDWRWVVGGPGDPGKPDDGPR